MIIYSSPNRDNENKSINWKISKILFLLLPIWITSKGSYLGFKILIKHEFLLINQYKPFYTIPIDFNINLSHKAFHRTIYLIPTSNISPPNI